MSMPSCGNEGRAADVQGTAPVGAVHCRTAVDTSPEATTAEWPAMVYSASGRSHVPLGSRTGCGTLPPGVPWRMCGKQAFCAVCARMTTRSRRTWAPSFGTTVRGIGLSVR